MVSESVFFFFFFFLFLLYPPPCNRLAAPFYSTCLSRCITKLNVKGHWFLSFTIQCLIVDRTNDARLLQLWSVSDATICTALSQPGSLTNQNAPHKEGHALRDDKLGGGGGWQIAWPSFQTIRGRQTGRGEVTFCCTVQQLLAIWVISVETSKVSHFFCQNAYVRIKLVSFCLKHKSLTTCQQMQTCAKIFLLIIMAMEIESNPSWCCLAGEMLSILPVKEFW